MVPRSRARSISYQGLLAEGYTRDDVKAAVASGFLFRARRDVYLTRDATDRQRSAARVGGRVDCLSLLADLGVFVLSEGPLHVQVPPTASRLRSSADRMTPLRRAHRRHRARVHWRSSSAERDDLMVPIVEALACAFRCQSVRATIASIDSALHQGLISGRDVDLVFALAEERFRSVRGLIDGRAESGPETFARLLARACGRTVEVQRHIEGVGRVDLLVDGWIVIECDSREFHSSWEAQAEDRRRDLALAARGYARIRITANQLYHSPGILLEALHGLLARGRP